MKSSTLYFSHTPSSCLLVGGGPECPGAAKGSHEGAVSTAGAAAHVARGGGGGGGGGRGAEWPASAGAQHDVHGQRAGPVEPVLRPRGVHGEAGAEAPRGALGPLPERDRLPPGPPHGPQTRESILRVLSGIFKHFSMVSSFQGLHGAAEKGPGRGVHHVRRAGGPVRQSRRTVLRKFYT